MPSRCHKTRILHRDIAAAAGCKTSTVAGAVERRELDSNSVTSVSEWVTARRAALGLSGAAPDLRVAGRALSAAGARAQRLSFGTFLWMPGEDGSWAYAGELAGQLGALRLPLPPWSDHLALADVLAQRGDGLSADAVMALRAVVDMVGVGDPVVRRLVIRRARRG